MHRNRLNLVTASLLTSAVLFVVGCPPDEYDWTWAAPGMVAAFLAGTQVGGGSEQITVERNCFENGEPVDCSRIPQAQLP
jgi:hypothetical protein